MAELQSVLVSEEEGTGRLENDVLRIRDFGVKKSFVKEVKKDYFNSRHWTSIQHGCRRRCQRRGI